MLSYVVRPGTIHITPIANHTSYRLPPAGSKDAEQNGTKQSSALVNTTRERLQLYNNISTKMQIASPCTCVSMCLNLTFRPAGLKTQRPERELSVVQVSGVLSTVNEWFYRDEKACLRGQQRKFKKIPHTTQHNLQHPAAPPSPTNSAVDAVCIEHLTRSGGGGGAILISGVIAAI